MRRACFAHASRMPCRAFAPTGPFVCRTSSPAAGSSSTPSSSSSSRAGISRHQQAAAGNNGQQQQQQTAAGSSRQQQAVAGSSREEDEWFATRCSMLQTCPAHGRNYRQKHPRMAPRMDHSAHVLHSMKQQGLRAYLAHAFLLISKLSRACLAHGPF